MKVFCSGRFHGSNSKGILMFLNGWTLPVSGNACNAFQHFNLILSYI